VVGRCLDGLRGEEKKVGWMLLAVPVGVFVWKVSLFFSFPFSLFRVLLPSLELVGLTTDEWALIFVALPLLHLGI
jgi:hypothetical protein